MNAGCVLEREKVRPRPAREDDLLNDPDVLR